MNAMSLQNRQRNHQVTLFSVLLQRYLAGKIAEPTWKSLMSVLDDNTTSKQQRMELVKLVNEATRSAA